MTPVEALPLLVEAGLPPHQIDEVLALTATLVASDAVSPGAREVWRRWQERVTPLHPTYLCLALRHAASPDEARAVTRSYLATHSGPEGCLDVAAAVDELGPHPLAATVLSEMLTPYVTDLPALATILRRACERDLALPIQQAIAHVLVLLAGAPARRRSRPPEVLAALALARELLGPVRARKRGRGRGRRRQGRDAGPAPGGQLPMFGKEGT